MALIPYWPKPKTSPPPPPPARKTTYPKWWGYEGLLNYPIVTPPKLRTPAEPAGKTSWANWMPYFRGRGIVPVGNYLTATSPAFRERLPKGALEAMKDFFASISPRSFGEYETFSQKYMSRTPSLSRRHWTYAKWR